jgi:hypothetical protein
LLQHPGAAASAVSQGGQIVTRPNVRTIARTSSPCPTSLSVSSLRCLRRPFESYPRWLATSSSQLLCSPRRSAPAQRSFVRRRHLRRSSTGTRRLRSSKSDRPLPRSATTGSLVTTYGAMRPGIGAVAITCRLQCGLCRRRLLKRSPSHRRRTTSTCEDIGAGAVVTGSGYTALGWLAETCRRLRLVRREQRPRTSVRYRRDHRIIRTNENTNGLLRRYMPKGIDIPEYSQAKLEP